MPIESATAIVFDIHRGSLNDGPGIRTTVFVKGCPLRCAWCHNPEAMKQAPETVLTSYGERKTYGQTMSAEEAISQVLKDQAYFKHSDGGVTISGGEPMISFDFTLKLAQRAKAQGIHTCLDSTGYGSESNWRTILPFIDLVLFDYKATGESIHKKWTGVEQTPLLKTLDVIQESQTDVFLRCPIIPQVNDNKGHFAAIGSLKRKYSVIQNVDILPYHETGRYKWEQLNRSYRLTHVSTPSQDTVNLWNDEIRSAQFSCPA